MSKYEGYECPVCKKQFEESDDIVVCPECGTPHHRECYNLVGHCVNRGLHKSNYDFVEENKDPVEPKKQNDNAEKAQPFIFAPFDAKQQEDSTDSNTENKNNSEQPFQPPFFSPMNISFVNPYEADRDTIDGESVADVAATVKTNVPRFISKFKKMEQTKKKSSWNWGAFFFGAYYYLFRKMYKQGVLLLSITTTISFLTVFLLNKFAPETYQAFMSFANSVFSNRGSIDASLSAQITSAADYLTASRISTICSGATLFVNIMATVFADYSYKKTVTGIIKNVDEQLNEGATIVQNPMLGGYENNFNEKQVRQLYLSKKGGTTILIPLLVYFILDIIVSYI